MSFPFQATPLDADAAHGLAELSPSGLLQEAVRAGFHFYRDGELYGRYTPTGRTSDEQARIEAIGRDLDRRHDEVLPSLRMIMDVSGDDDLP